MFTSNGGFHVLKADGVTPFFYPKKNVQGTKNDIIKKKFISLIPQTHEPDTATNHQATACHQDGSEQV